MSVRLFIGNLPYAIQEADLREHFAAVGEPSRVLIPVDRETGALRGFAFVDFEDRAVAEAAIRTLDGQPLAGRPLKVSEARPRGEGPPPGSQMSSTRPSGAGDPVSRPAGSGAEAPRRSFGPNALPRRGGKPRRFSSERAPKGPIPVRSGGRVFSMDDDSRDDSADLETPETPETAGGDLAPNENNQ